MRVRGLFRADLTLFYFYRTFYSIAKNRFEKGLSERPDEELTYGETPYITIHKIMKKISIPQDSFFLDLGCGKGKLVFYIHRRFRIRAAGMDVIPTYISAATRMAKREKMENVKFIQKDFLTSKIPNASIIYVTCTCLSNDTRKKLFDKFESVSPGTVIVTASYPINRSDFKLEKSFKAYFSWGKTMVYIQHKIG